MGGILKHAPALSAILAPTVNSYKRLVRGSPRSGATWAPVYITYGSANRTQMIRVPGPGRIENRMVDAAANPYLACAAMLAAGLDGIDHQIDPGAPNQDNLYAVQARGIGHLPSTLEAAIEALSQDEVSATRSVPNTPTTTFRSSQTNGRATTTASANGNWTTT